MNWMISMCVSLCLGSGLLLLEFYLSKKKAWQAGLIPILIVGVFACGLESYMEQQYRGYQIFTDAYPMTNGMTASMTIKQDAEQNKVDLKLLMKALRDYTDIRQLTPEIVNALIRRIEVHSKDKKTKKVKVDIYFTAVGLFTPPTEQALQMAMEEIRRNPQQFGISA